MREQMFDNDDAMLLACGLTRKPLYKVPDGYFDALPRRVMERISEQNPKVMVLGRDLHDKLKYWLGAGIAASLILGFVGMKRYTLHHGSDAFAAEEQYAFDLMDYGMVDTDDVYAYLSGDDF